MATRFTFHIEADTVEEMRRAVREAQPAGSTPTHTLDDWSSDKLLAELRERYAKEGLVVRVVPFGDDTEAREEAFAGGPPGAKTVTEKPPGAPRKPKATEPEPTREEPKTMAPDSPNAGGDAAPVEGKQPTLDDVKAALNAFAGTKGQAAARELMQEHGGAYRLADVPPEKYAALVNALNPAQATAA